MSYIASWSGGKDGCFACYKSMELGYDISYIISFISDKADRVHFHGIDSGIIKAQSEAIEIPLVEAKTRWENYEQDFKEAVRRIIPIGVHGMIFGDMYVDEHKEWVERVCSELRIEAVEPLWGLDTEDVYNDFINSGFEAVIINARADKFDKNFIGRTLDKEVLQYLKEKGIDPCGELGEYHTVVTDGPMFKSRIHITGWDVIQRDEHWFMVNPKYVLEKK